MKMHAFDFWVCGCSLVLGAGACSASSAEPGDGAGLQSAGTASVAPSTGGTLTVTPGPVGGAPLGTSMGGNTSSGGTPTASLGGTAPLAQSGASSGGMATAGMAAGGALSSGGTVSTAGVMNTAGAESAPPTPACTTSATELCEDFESGMISDATWSQVVTNNAASLSVDSEHVHGGDFALHVHVPAGEQTTAQVEETVTFPALQETLYARMYLYLGQELPSDPGGGYHMGFIQAVGHNDLGEVRSSVGSIADRQVLGDSLYFGPPFHEFGPWSDTRYAAGQWYCVELFTSGAGGLNTERRIWIDGTEEMVQHTNYDGQNAPLFEHISFGIWQYHPTPNLADAWIDDIRVSGERIGCE